ncbi:GntR family transcriptional regulator [Polycladomyces sp. WAk]|uniref:GntR family transcriptional regulator n=1 Tax=Polycladomyces zharkentensis TaxID=2807616 RepID=A0ABS2WGM9_9BACL|nr:GntR family transcriptional regulator [Polycladomyces sp. WAk]
MTNLRRRSTFDQRYERFVRSLREQIVTGQLKPGDFILSEHELADLYELSRGSVRKALSELVSEGLLLKIAGRGNMVTYPRKGDVRLATIKLGWFSPSYELPVVRQLLQRFEERYPMLRVQLVPIPTPEYVETLMEWNASETVIDVFVLPDFFFLRWVQQGWMHQLHPYLPEEMQREQSTYPQLLRMFQHDGMQYATPFVFSPVVIGYHRRMGASGRPTRFVIGRDWWKRRAGVPFGRRTANVISTVFVSPLPAIVGRCSCCKTGGGWLMPTAGFFWIIPVTSRRFVFAWT